MKLKNKIIFLFFILATRAFSETIPDPCASDVLAVVNRPSPTGSACALPNKTIMLEGGYQYLNLSAGAHGYITPQAEIRFGLPHNNEFVLIAPTYIHQTISPRAGWAPVSLSFKHELGYNEHWVTAVEGLLAVPSGSESYGSHAFSGTINGIATYSAGPIFSVSAMLGVMSISNQAIDDGQRFNSVNPDVDASWQLNDHWLVFAELYAQTRTGPKDGMAWLTDGGIYYLMTRNIVFDAEVGQRISGEWGFQSYVGAGAGVLFG